MSKDLPKTYNPTECEDEIYKKWEESGFFQPEAGPPWADNPDRPTFTVSMPPPNVTGVLHLGHALENSIMDIIVRFKRMQGKKALLVPGTDHAAVATQARVEKDLIKSGKYKNPRQELGREKLLAIIREYAENCKGTILKQIRKLGTSCDWSRLAYTFDQPREKAVNEMFIRMYNDGLIYRGYRVVNWSVKGRSTCSDDELEYVEKQTKLYTFKYSQDFPIPIATTRPETKLGDTAVAVNPNDDRYRQYVGQTFTVDVGAERPLEIKIIGDEAVEAEFGTGAVGVTPAHSMIDFELKEKHDLELIQVIDQSGHMTQAAGKDYQGLKYEEAREKFVKWLNKNGLLINQENISHNVGTSDRFGDVVEVLPMTQWFVDVNKKIPERGKSLKELMREAVTTGHNGDAQQKVKITPERFEKIYLNWIDNLRDWCISRQIWWGHRIPVWYRARVTHFKKKILYKKLNIKDDAEFDKFSDNFYVNNNEKIQWATPGNSSGEACLSLGYVNLLKNRGYLDESWVNNNKIKKPTRKEEIVVGENAPEEIGWVQDEDTLDTWFSSGLWTFSILGWPNKTEDLKKFHPNTWMQMGYEILFFWMARMILMSTYALDEIPFKDVYIHGMLRDFKGRKFSKSKGIGVDPMEVCEQYGTDALRLSVVIGISPGNDSRFYENKVKGYRNFVNKLWNIGRFVQMMEKQNSEIRNLKSEIQNLTLADKWIASRMNRLIGEVTEHLENFQFSLAGEKLYNFTWHELADWYVEIAKIQNNLNTYSLLITHYSLLLKLLHPFIPFVTEKIWEYFQPNVGPPRADGSNKMLMIEKWPELKESHISQQAEQDFAFIQELITQIRSWRKENKKEPKEILKIQVGAELSDGKLLEEQRQVIEKLARVELEIVKQLDGEKTFDVANVRVKVID